MLSDDPNELRGEEAVAFGVLDRALADLIAVVEHNGRSLKISRGDREIPNTPEARAELRDEVIDWFFNPDDGEFSLNLVCGHLGCSPEAWAWSVHQYLDNPKRHGIPLHWRRLDRGKVTEIELALKAHVPEEDDRANVPRGPDVDHEDRQWAAMAETEGGMTEHHILLLGAGVQSTAIFLLMRQHVVVVPKAIVAVFADTQEEPAAVYKHLEWLKKLEWPPIYVRTRGKLGDAVIGERNWKKGHTSIPAFGKIGTERQSVMPRRCTTDFKIEVIEQFIREEMLGLQPRMRRSRSIPIHQYYGISRDEARRAVSIHERAKEKGFIVHFPLLEIGWSRGNCLRFLAEWVPHPTPRSACSFCPYRSDREWLLMKQNDPESWQKAIAMDRALRVEGSYWTGVREKLYLHRSLTPLEMVDFNPQSDLGFVLECSTGVCGV